MSAKCIHLLLTFFIATFIMSCGNSQNSSSSETITTSHNDIIANVNKNIRPQDDFYQYVNSSWLRDHPLNDEYFYRYDKMMILSNKVTKQIKNIIQDVAKKENLQDLNEQKIADLYNLTIDINRLNSEGFEPIKEDLKKIDAIKDVNYTKKLLPKFLNKGVKAYFNVDISIDKNDSNKYLLKIIQSGLGLPSKESYKDEELVKKYKNHIIAMFKLAGISDAKTKSGYVLEIEKRIAKTSLSYAELEDLDKTYNLMTIDDLQTHAPDINWTTFLADLSIDTSYVKKISVQAKVNLKDVSAIVGKDGNVSIDKQKAYLKWCLINASSEYLSEEVYKKHFDFYKKELKGVKKPTDRNSLAIAIVNAYLGIAVGKLYVKKHFRNETKEKTLKMVKNIQNSLRQRIKTSSWMHEKTKTNAIAKLDAFDIRIGYPDKWEDDSYLKIDKTKSLWKNIAKMMSAKNENSYDDLKNTFDKSLWALQPQTVNAFYFSGTNSITLTAAILQYPFFDTQADEAYNYGAIGTIIGHEITHGFDNSGRLFDKDGNRKDWWTKEDSQNFNDNAKKLIEYFNKIELLPGFYADGNLTLGENLADYGGLTISFDAFKQNLKQNPLKTISGFSPEQRFFISNASIYAQNISDKTIKSQTSSDEHSINKWRVNGTFPQTSAWYKVFNVKPDDKMYLEEDKRVNIW